MRFAVLALLAIGLPAQAFAQTTINPTTVEFTASPDHFAKTVDGVTDIVTSYQFEATAMNASGALVLSVWLGKPTPNAQNVITVPVAQLATLTPEATYTATVQAIGPGGVGVSAPSNFFARAGVPRAPAAASNVKVR